MEMCNNICNRFAVNDNSAWIRDKNFSKKDNPQNIHTFFRKNFELDNNILQARLTFTADDYCKIYINGQFAVSGPAPGYVHHYYFMTVDVTNYLSSGNNCIAIHSYYQGLKNRVWNSGDGLSGFKANLSIEYCNGRKLDLATDESWHCYNCEAYISDRILVPHHNTQYAEDIDMRLLPDWKSVKFDDSKWQKPEIVENYPHQLYQQPTQPLTWEKISPTKITRIAQGRYLIDFGRETVGCTGLNVTGRCGQVIEIRHAEELNSDSTAMYKIRANCEYQEFITLSGAMDHVEFFDYKGFRYIEILDYPGEMKSEDIYVNERTYPFDNAATLNTSDHILDKIWDLCRLTVKLGTQDSFLDCMTREKGAYLGDAFVTGQSHLYLTGKSEMLKKVLTDFAASPCPGIQAVAPGAFEQHIADYSLLFIPLLYEYYLWTGDLEFIKQMKSSVDNLLEYFQAFENNEMLLEDFTVKPVMVDWPKGMRDNYDDDNLMGVNPQNKGTNTVLNTFYYGTIDAAAKFYEVVRNPLAVSYRQKGSTIKQKLKEKFLTANGFVDAAGSNHASLHANSLALMFNLVTHEEAKRVIAVIKEKRIKCGVYFSFFLLKGLFNYGEAEFAYELITSDDTNSWQNMLKEGATTCMEAWSMEQKPNISLCHPWASAPVYMAAAEIFGLKPAAPGWKIIHFSPQIPEAMQHGLLCFNIPDGEIKVSFKRNGDEIEFHVKIPSELRVLYSGKQNIKISGGSLITTEAQREKALLPD